MTHHMEYGPGQKALQNLRKYSRSSKQLGPTLDKENSKYVAYNSNNLPVIHKNAISQKYSLPQPISVAYDPQISPFFGRNISDLGSPHVVPELNLHTD